MKEAVQTMSDDLYHRFIDAFKDENESLLDDKRPNLVQDNKVEERIPMLEKRIQHEQTSTNVEQLPRKSSRFQRWILHYLKAPFKKWEPSNMKQIASNSKETNTRDNHQAKHDDEEEKNILNSSSFVSADKNNDQSDKAEEGATGDNDIDDDDDLLDIDDDAEDQSSIIDSIKQRLNTVARTYTKPQETTKSKVCHLLT
jgi:hypothetical protein